MDTSTLLEELHLNNIRTTVLNKKLNIFSPATTISINPSLIQQDTRNAKHSNGVGILSEALARDKIALIAQRNSAKKQANLVKLKHYTTNYNGAKTVAKREISIGKKSLLASLTSSETDHVLNIKVSPTNREISASYHQSEGNISVVHINNSMVHSNNENGSRSVVNLNSNNSEIKIMFKNANKSNTIKMASGQCSPTTSDHLDSGTCSDVELNMPASPLPPPLPKKMNKHNQLSDSICSNSDESVSSLSSDSLSYHNNNLLSPELIKSLDNHNKKHTCIVLDNRGKKKSIGIFPSSLLKDIRDHSLKLGINDSIYYKSRTTDDEEEDNDVAYNLLKSPMLVNQVRNYESGIRCNLRTDIKNISLNRNASDHIFYEKDQFYQFHINEHLASIISEPPAKSNTSDIDESFAGLKDLNNGTSTIRSNKGTVRGVKNRVRNGIATFLQMQQSTVKVNNFFN